MRTVFYSRRSGRTKFKGVIQKTASTFRVRVDFGIKDLFLLKTVLCTHQEQDSCLRIDESYDEQRYQPQRNQIIVTVRVYGSYFATLLKSFVYNIVCTKLFINNTRTVHKILYLTSILYHKSQ